MWKWLKPDFFFFFYDYVFAKRHQWLVSSLAVYNTSFTFVNYGPHQCPEEC